MKEASPNPQSKSHGGTHRSSRRSDPESLPLGGPKTSGFDSEKSTTNNSDNGASTSLGGANGSATPQPAAGAATDPDGSGSKPRGTTSPQTAESGAVVGVGGDEKEQKPKRTIFQSIWYNTKSVLMHTKLNVLLAFVPVGIAVSQVDGASPGLIFAMNAVAIVPLAGLLSFATESVAHRLGDSLGALLNVTFGNAVELIIL